MTAEIWTKGERLPVGCDVRLSDGEVHRVIAASPRRMLEPTKPELRRRLAVAEAQAAYHEGMRPLARLRRWWGLWL